MGEATTTFGSRVVLIRLLRPCSCNLSLSLSLCLQASLHARERQQNPTRRATTTTKNAEAPIPTKSTKPVKDFNRLDDKWCDFTCQPARRKCEVSKYCGRVVCPPSRFFGILMLYETQVEIVYRHALFLPGLDCRVATRCPPLSSCGGGTSS